MLSAAAAADTAPSFAELREREFARLDRQGVVYLDSTGSALYGESQIRAHHELLREGIFGNPHSEHGPSRASADVIGAARHTLLRFLGVDERSHEVVFTANTTAAIKLVAESYPFSPDTPLLLSADNHNSVNGVREYARRAGAPVRYVPLDPQLRLRDVELEQGGLLAFPAQSNFSGVRHPLSLVSRARERGYRVLLDAAAFLPAQTLCLRECPADFVALSFYKLFGFPTGVGALVARRDALAVLRRPWFAGGTVHYASVRADTHRLRSGPEAFEDGTPDFLSIAALEPGFALIDAVGMARIAAHVAGLTERFLGELSSLRHRNGLPLVRMYGPPTMKQRGGTIAFNVCDRAGQVIPYPVVEGRATAAKIALRGGCFCNPGAAEAALGLDPERVSECLTALGDDFTVARFATCLGSPVGAVRVSFGLANNEDDLRKAIALVASFRN
jgi:selenocysteine lyase/cysteine desulfurase